MTHSNASEPIVALEARFKGCPMVHTLGVRPNFWDYSEDDRKLILNAPKIYYPSSLYVDLFHAIGKKTFPSSQNYHFAQDKIKQTALFQIAGINHPRTRVFYGKRQKKSIADYFELPFIAKEPRGSALGRGVHLIRTLDDLNLYCQKEGPAYIQEYMPNDRDIRVVVVGKKVMHAYWRVAAPGDFRNNVSAGARIDFAAVPQEALELALHTAKVCQWDDVGLDICEFRGTFYVLEGNMKYGREGFKQAGLNYLRMMLHLIQTGEI